MICSRMVSNKRL